MCSSFLGGFLVLKLHIQDDEGKITIVFVVCDEIMIGC